MIRFLFRFAAMLSLAVSVIMAVLDTTRSVVASQIVMTPLRTSWNSVSPDTLVSFETFVRGKLHPLAWDMGLSWVIDQPGFILFALLAFLLYCVGYRRQPLAGRYAIG
ncbi:hypothetical protein ASD44_11070 [Mesorhizobium sp. Root554]|uniref:hypothetical protein n=1 Tax=unclassified Mesorhizobium TaxID=325217 RepID=UPI0006F3005F|nr:MULTISPECIES: hypothetical protein [unclassified Mesorhizobium]KQZ14553.1 hypothetical protein ASD27_11080 [Mesorhizobium sp. Root1471]KQZ37060.1 hypothetical protein ASD44_11070 [Mesorhizobium sp. Root554]